jgi:hypothetical protein
VDSKSTVQVELLVELNQEVVIGHGWLLFSFMDQREQVEVNVFNA